MCGLVNLHASLLLLFQKAFERIKEGSILGNLEFLVFICFFFVKWFKHGECKQQQTTKIARLWKLLDLKSFMPYGAGERHTHMQRGELQTGR